MKPLKAGAGSSVVESRGKKEFLMLHVENKIVRDLLLKGNIGLEKESLRVDQNGHMAHTPHPFDLTEEHIVRDFCENQTEINTPVCHSAKEACESLKYYYQKIQRRLKDLPEPELLWPFSNPPYIRDEEDIPVARFEGAKAFKTVYREYLSDRYGRYKMTYSGIHFNFSFAEELLRADYELEREEGEKKSFEAYKDQVYLNLAEHAASYGWLITAVTAASPLQDSSFVEKGVYDKDVFLGMASVRCSELGYWNPFTPVFDYSSVSGYVKSIQDYVDEGLLRAPSELYFPIRLKPRGENNLQTLLERGIDHIELRMFDLNPLDSVGVDERDIFFAQLFLIWLAAKPKGT